MGAWHRPGRDVPTAAVVAGSDGDDTGEATHFRGDALVRHGDARAARLGGATTPRTTSLGERLGSSTFPTSPLPFVCSLYLQ